MNFKSVLYDTGVSQWEDAVRMVSDPLIAQECILPSYQEAMIQNINSLGSYMILMPGVAMPHSRPEDGVLQTSVSLLILEKPVLFPGEQEAWFILCLAAKSSDEHIEVIESIAELLGDDDKLEQLKQAKSIEQIKNLL